MKYEVPRFANPADFFMKVLSVRYPKPKEDEEKIEQLTNYYRVSMERKVTAENNLIKLAAPDLSSAENVSFKPDVSLQLTQLYGRSWILAKREPRLSRAKIL